MKFKVGNKVKVISPGWNTAPEEVGCIYTIKKVETEHYPDSGFIYFFHEERNAPGIDPGDYACEDGLELVHTTWKERYRGKNE